MKPTIATRTVLVIMIVVAAVGSIDAAADRAWDLVAVLALLILLTVVLLARTTLRRPLVPLRRDLYRWLARRAATTGERTEHVADRAVSAYRAGLVGDDEHDERHGS